MLFLHATSYFFGGAFLINAVPHLISGVLGRPFQSPFAKPPGEGLSSATVNVLWGFANLVIAYLLIWHVGSFDLKHLGDALAAGLGAFACALMTARLFGRFNGGNAPDGS